MEKESSNTALHFPDGFLWGASTASYQVEGGIDNTDWAEAGRKGRVPPCGRACDHYNRFEEDFDLITNLSQNAHRLSLEWARIEPEEGKFDDREIEHYRKVLQALKRRGITPFVNLWHFTQPQWFSSSGSFLRKDGPEIFARYCRFVIERLGGESQYWLTINEPEIWAYNSFARGKWPPFGKNMFTLVRMMRALARAHKAAYHAIKQSKPDALVGIAKDNFYFDSSKNKLMQPSAALLSWAVNRWYLDAIEGHQDFIGLNHYFHIPLGWKPEADVPRNDMGWELHPDSLFHCLMELKRYNLPVYVTENGLADKHDTQRANFITSYVAAMHRAIEAGVDVRGYFHWSLMDNYEWAEGFSECFGLVAIDYNTLQRTIRPSARVYEKICRTNSLSF